ncbi:translocation and assembly module lipoprotein TamL [Mucilaginibacter sp.]
MRKHLTVLTITSILLSACSNTKYLAPGQKLYTGGEIKITDKQNTTTTEAKALSADLAGLPRPKPNAKILGLRYKLYLYNRFYTTKKKGLRHFFFSKGEPPVLVSSVDLVGNSTILKNRLENVGYFQSQVVGDTVTKGRYGKAVYTVQTGPAYKYRKVVFPQGRDPLDTAVAGTSAKSFLKAGDKYNLDVVKNERLRIDARLKEEGFYYFAPEQLLLQRDTTVGNHMIDAFLIVKPQTPNKARRIYTINDIYLYPRYSLRDTALKLDSAVKYRWYNVIDPRHTVKPFVFKNAVLLQPGDVYNRTEHNNSLNRMIDLGPFKFVKNRFENVSTDSSKLNVFYFLTQYPKKSLQLDLLGRTTSANYNGTQINLTFRDRNTFKGAEALSVTLFGSTDGQIGGANGGYPLSQVGIQTTLSWPRFISPFNFKSDNAYIPRTNLTLGYSVVRRSQLYTLNSFSGSFGYQWKENVHKQHEFNPINVTFVNPVTVDTLYTDSIKKTRNPALKHVIDRQFTFGPSYTYTYTNTTETYKRNTIYFSTRVSESAVVAGLLAGADTLAGKSYSIFGSTFNQYVKADNELRYYHKVGLNSQIAARINVGIGIPFGNSTILPYSQQFFIGGPNSLRGFRARSIGPGTVNPEQYLPQTSTANSRFLADQSGDLKLEANLEYRPKLFSIVYGALFVDAGNIWDLKYHKGLEGGTFGKNFLSQLAADVGFGLRFDASVIVLRTDLGFPVRKPWQVGNEWGFDSKNAVFNLAIGYPF